MPDESSLKPVIWVGSSRKDLREFPEPVQDHMDMPYTSLSVAESTAIRKLLVTVRK
jgi:phage-related protein